MCGVREAAIDDGLLTLRDHRGGMVLREIPLFGREVSEREPFTDGDGAPPQPNFLLLNFLAELISGMLDFSELSLLCWQWFPLGQLEAPGQAPPANEVRDGGGLFGGLGWFLPAMLAILLVYFLMMSKPQQRDQQKQKEMLSSLKMNDRVLTVGGIVGSVVSIREDTNLVTLRVDDSTNTKIQVIRTAIAKVLTDEDTKVGDVKSNKTSSSAQTAERSKS